VNLRTQLSLFFGGLIVVVLSVLVTTNYRRFYNNLEDGLKAQFSLEPYLQLAEVDRTLLVERAKALVDRTPVLNGVRRINTVLAEKGVEGIEAIRADKTNSEDFVQLTSTYEQMLQVLNRTSGDEGQDLVVLASQEGVVIAETFNKVLKDNAALELEVTRTTLNDTPFWSTVAEFDSARGYLVYPNERLYLFGTASFESRFAYEGVAVVGMEIDRSFLRSIAKSESVADSEAAETHAFVLYGEKLVASSDTAAALARELSRKRPNGDTWTSSSGETFLVKSTELRSYYLSDDELQGFEEMGLSDQLPQVQEVGRVYLMRNLAGVQDAAFHGAQTTLLLGAIALVLSLLAIPLLARRFTEPIGELSLAMKEVGEGILEPLDEKHLSSIVEVKEAAHSFNQMIIGLRQKKILEHFVPEGTRKEIEELQGRTTNLGGQRWERTIMFSDLRGFTSMSEQMTPDQVMAVLNKYLHVMSKAIRLNNGDINEYIGDAILAVFESPDDAVRAGIAMTQELEELRKDTSIAALAGLAQGIGLHTGPLVEGNIGEENKRLKRAVVGDTVNLAARIQDRSRDGSFSCIFLSQSTKDKLTTDVDLVHFGDEEFKGKAEPIPVWEVKL
jgi:class 3 adenylate cyclase/methyl-accepting chemotaxis protein